MLKRFQCGATLVAATATMFKLYDNADNPPYDDQDGSHPTQGTGGKKHDLNALVIGASAELTVEVGLCDTGKTAFTPAFTINFPAGGSPVTIDLSRFGRPSLDLAHATINHIALRVTSVAGGATKWSGGVDLSPGF